MVLDTLQDRQRANLNVVRRIGIFHLRDHALSGIVHQETTSILLNEHNSLHVIDFMTSVMEIASISASPQD